MFLSKNSLSLDYKLKDQKVEEQKDIGVTVDDLLSFENHINEKVSKVNYSLGLLGRMFQYLDWKISIAVFF